MLFSSYVKATNQPPFPCNFLSLSSNPLSLSVYFSFFLSLTLSVSVTLSLCLSLQLHATSTTTTSPIFGPYSFSLSANLEKSLSLIVVFSSACFSRSTYSCIISGASLSLSPSAFASFVCLFLSVFLSLYMYIAIYHYF